MIQVGSDNNLPAYSVNNAFNEKNEQLLRIEAIVEQSWYYLGLALAGAAVLAKIATIVLPSTITFTLLAITLLALTVLAIKTGVEYVKPHLSPNMLRVCNQVQAVLEDVLIVLSQIILKPIYLFTRVFPKVEDPANGPDIIYAHGWGSNVLSGLILMCYLRIAGVGRVHSINFGLPLMNNNDKYAQKLRRKMLKIKEKTGRNNFVLVGHSMGGVVSHRVFNKYAEGLNIRQIITAGSPLEGTKLAHLSPDQCAKEMRPGCDFIENLGNDVNANKDKPTQFMYITSETETVVYPHTSALFNKNESPNVKRITLTGTGHLGYFFKINEVIKPIVEFIRNGYSE